MIPADTLDVPTLAAAPALDGAVSEREYGTPSLRIATAQGEVRVWVARSGGWLHVAAALPDTSYYWGDDLVISLDPEGDGGDAPRPGDRQWYLRRTLDSSVVATAVAGRWTPPGAEPRALGAVRQGPDWAVASASAATGWSVELRVRESAARVGASPTRVAFRTYDDAPRGWWSWPAPAAGVPAQRVERSPASWVPLRWAGGPPSPDR